MSKTAKAGILQVTVLTLWPTLIAVLVTMALIWFSSGDFARAWQPNWQLVFHMSVAAIAPAAALSSALGLLWARKKEWLAFLVPILSVVLTAAGIVLHFYLVGTPSYIPIAGAAGIGAFSLAGAATLVSIRR